MKTKIFKVIVKKSKIINKLKKNKKFYYWVLSLNMMPWKKSSTQSSCQLALSYREEF